ncbi:MAG: hypothetical protein P8P30_00825 [Rickettsiales bacterium]|nr:hypothetical protein [Rickettsiales bacterium]
MTISRVSTFAIHQSTLGDVSRVQANLADLQGQISSGKQTDRFQGLGTQVEHFVSLESKIAKAENYVESGAIILARVNTSGLILDGIIETVDDIEDLLVLRRAASTGETLQFRSQLLSMRDRITEALNSTFEGRHLFAGTRTNVPPVVDNPSSRIPGVADNAYYQGSSEDLIARLDDNIEINYGLRADAEGFQKVIAAITQALNVDDDSSSGNPNLEAAQALVQEGLQDLIAEKTDINANIVAIDAISVRHQELQLYWQGVKGRVIDTDIVAASTQVAIDQTILQAAFQSFSTINRLRLVDFL